MLSLLNPGLQRTLVYLVAILALTILAGVAIVTGHDPQGLVLSNVLTAIGVLAGAAAGSHAANGAAGVTIKAPPAQAELKVETSKVEA